MLTGVCSKHDSLSEKLADMFAAGQQTCQKKHVSLGYFNGHEVKR